MLPYGPKANAIDGATGYFHRFADFGAAKAAGKHEPHLANEVVVKNGPVMAFALRPVLSVAPSFVTQNVDRMAHILKVSAPFEVFRSIVGSVAVQMINLCLLFRVGMEGKRDKAVARKAYPLSVASFGFADKVAAGVGMEIKYPLPAANDLTIAGRKISGIIGNGFNFQNHLLPTMAK